MDFAGTYIVAAPRMRVWEALNDTEVLKAAIPGCKSIAWNGQYALEARIAVNLGVTHPTFAGDLVLSDVIPAERYTLSGSGRGGLLGKAHAQADISLRDHAQGTVLAFDASGGASGQIMKLGRSLLGKSAQKVIDGFFLRFGEAMGAHVTPIERDAIV